MIHFIDMPRPQSGEERATAKEILRTIIGILTKKEVRDMGRINPFLIKDGFYTNIERFREWDMILIRKEKDGNYTLMFQRWAREDKNRQHTIEGVPLGEIGTKILETLDWNKPEE